MSAGADDTTDALVAKLRGYGTAVYLEAANCIDDLETKLAAVTRERDEYKNLHAVEQTQVKPTEPVEPDPDEWCALKLPRGAYDFRCNVRRKNHRVCDHAFVSAKEPTK